MPTKEPPKRPASAGQPVPEDPALSGPSRDDTDVGWGELPEAEDDDERLRRDRPPHWDCA